MVNWPQISKAKGKYQTASAYPIKSRLALQGYCSGFEVTIHARDQVSMPNA
jgi:hypothetical protein